MYSKHVLTHIKKFLGHNFSLLKTLLPFLAFGTLIWTIISSRETVGLSLKELWDYIVINWHIFVSIYFLLLILYIYFKWPLTFDKICYQTRLTTKLRIKDEQLAFNLLEELHKLEHIFITHQNTLNVSLEIYQENQIKIKSITYEIEKLQSKKENIKDQKLVKEINQTITAKRKKLKNITGNKIQDFEQKYSGTISDMIGDILEQYQVILNLLFKDVSINIKRYSKKTILKTYKRVPSTFEQMQIRERLTFLPAKFRPNALRARDENETFKLFRHTSIEELTDKASKDKNHSTNMAYNIVCDNDTYERYWICNNLKKATSQNLFFSTSKDYENYYRSLAVFLLTNIAEPDKKKSDENVIGLLIFDAPKTNTFDINHMRELGGYLTHKLYTFLDNSKIYLGSENIINK